MINIYSSKDRLPDGKEYISSSDAYFDTQVEELTKEEIETIKPIDNFVYLGNNKIETPYGVCSIYDLVEGPMVDDQIWDYVEDFIERRITREAFWALCKFRYPTHQICLNFERSLDVIKFLESYEVDNV